MHMDKSWKSVTYVRPSQSTAPDRSDKDIRILNDMLDVIFSYPELRSEIDSYLNNSSKISAIKTLKNYYDMYHQSRNYTLKHFKFTIDKYQIRLNIHNKLNKLIKRIEKWCDRNGYEKVGLQKEVKDELTGDYVYMYTDWEMVDDHIGLTVNDRQWRPSNKQMKQYNRLWRKYVY